MLTLDLKLQTEQQENYKAVLSICSLQANIEVTADPLVRWLHFSTTESSTVLSCGWCSANSYPLGQQTASVGLPLQPQQ